MYPFCTSTRGYRHSVQASLLANQNAQRPHVLRYPNKIRFANNDIPLLATWEMSSSFAPMGNQGNKNYWNGLEMHQ